jgi:type I restriction enzyme S subunit
MNTLPQYPAYKPAGVPWLQQVPEHWSSARAKSLFQKVERPVRPEDETVTCFRDGTVTLRKNRRATGYTESLKEIGYQGVRKGDLVIHVMDAFAGSMGVSDSDGKSTPVYSVCVPRGSEVPWYFAYQLRQMARAGWLQALSKGIRERSSDFRFELFGMQTMLVPPPDEQHLIVRYLRALDAKVKRYIRTKRKLIATLQEQKQAIIQRAVTRGLDPNVKLKPSGVEWLGEVPEHWEVRSNRSMLRIRKVQVGDRSKEYVLLSLTLRGVIARDMVNPEGKFPAEFNTYQEVRPGDLVFCLFDVDETPRTVGLSQLHGMITGAYTVFECIDPMIAKFLYYFYLAVDHQKSLKPFYTGLRKVVQKSTFLGIKVAIPSRNEIGPIIEYLEQEVGAVDAGIARVEQEIKLMNEYHTRLIADVVTGAVDVREAAGKLPEEDQMIGGSDDQMMEEEPLSMASEGEAEYGEEGQ